MSFHALILEDIKGKDISMTCVLIVEDEEYTRRYLTKIVAEHPPIDQVYATASGKEAIIMAKTSFPDIAFLDIELNPEERINGIELAQEISMVSPSTRLVFITGFTQYLLASFTVHPYDYLVKPVSKNRITKTLDDLVQKVPKHTDKDTPKIFLKTQKGILLLRPDDIIMIEKVAQKSMVYTTLSTDVYEVSYTLGDLELLLPAGFIRIHRSFIANIDKIKLLKSVGSQTYEVSFYDCDKTAIFSRMQYYKYRHLFGHLTK